MADTDREVLLCRRAHPLPNASRVDDLPELMDERLPVAVAHNTTSAGDIDQEPATEAGDFAGLSDYDSASSVVCSKFVAFIIETCLFCLVEWLWIMALNLILTLIHHLLVSAGDGYWAWNDDDFQLATSTFGHIAACLPYDAILAYAHHPPPRAVRIAKWCRRQVASLGSERFDISAPRILKRKGVAHAEKD